MSEVESRTPLIMAIRANNKEAVWFLLERGRAAGVSLEARDLDGKAATGYAQESGDEQMQEIFEGLM
jgi:ankyrin repeat protein